MKDLEQRKKDDAQRWHELEWKRNSCDNCMSYRIDLEYNLIRKVQRYRLVCASCGHVGPWASTINGAIRKWNKRRD